MSLMLLIDGYNLLHATGALYLSRGQNALAKARERMLAQIAASLTEPERLQTQVVFDAKRGGNTGDRETESVVRGMTVTFAAGFAEADELIERIIRQHPNPKLLTVVSSDLRIQRCATARKATALGCDQYLMQLFDGPQPKAETEEGSDEEPRAQLSPDEVQKWLKEFGL